GAAGGLGLAEGRAWVVPVLLRLGGWRCTVTRGATSTAVSITAPLGELGLLVGRAGDGGRPW
ncbi:hypothetical protein ACLESD_19280, partial [Pyxidicoccus sp. 3LFB2]